MSRNAETGFSKPEDYQLGTSKIFLKNRLHFLLESARNLLILEATVRIQAKWRAYKVKGRFRSQVKAAVKIQRYYRSMKQRLHFLKLKKSALVIQSHLRGKYGREVVKTMKEMKRIEKELRMREEERRNSTATSGSNYNSVDELLDLLLNEEISSPELKREEVKCSISFDSSMTSLSDDDYDINEEEDENGSSLSDFDRSNNSINTIQSPIESTVPSEGSEISEPGPTPEIIPEVKSHLEFKTPKIIPKQPPTLPEPTLPPPPPPPAFFTPPSNANHQIIGPAKTSVGVNGKEPIYESIRLLNGLPAKQTKEVSDAPKIPDQPPPASVEEAPIPETGNENEAESDDAVPVRPHTQHYDLVNYANDYFNDIYESNLMDTLKKKPKLIPKSEMIKYSKSNTISNSHIYLYDPDNIQIALNIWKVLFMLYSFVH